MFEDFLKEKHGKNYTGTDDGMSDSFERWLSDLDVQELMDFAEEAIVFYGAKALGSIKSKKKSVSSKKNGKLGGRPKK